DRCARRTVRNGLGRPPSTCGLELPGACFRTLFRRRTIGQPHARIVIGFGFNRRVTAHARE
ncbi:MAG TPA: hypothetical protein VF783_10680, partial [Terriglobales bacterium]